MNPRDLKFGDILLLKDKSHHFFRHAAVVSHVDNEKSIHKIIHWRVIGEPFGISESILSSAEALSTRNYEYECFRLIDQEQASKATKILQNWLTWAVPYDEERFAKAEKSVNQFFSITTDLKNDIAPNITEENFSQKLESHRQAMEKLFEDNFMDLVKYAARRDISPVRPKSETEKQTGFHCLQGILLAFQISYAQDFVVSVTDKWVSNKNVITNINLNNAKPRFENAKFSLKPDFNLQQFLSVFPLAFRLQAKLSSIDTFRHAMLSNKENITFIGNLNPLKEAEIKADLENVMQTSLFYKNQGNLKRNKLLFEVVIPSIKDQIVELKKNNATKR